MEIEIDHTYLWLALNEVMESKVETLLFVGVRRALGFCTVFRTSLSGHGM